jgi:deoxyribonuclease-4
MPRLGAHMSIAGGLPLALDRAHAADCETLQIFTKSANQWRARVLPEEEITAFKTRSKDLNIWPIVAHASYLINIASPDPELRQRSLQALTEEMDRAEALDLLGLVLHPGSYTTGTEAGGLKLVSEAITKLMANRATGKAMLLLEHTAGQGTNLGHRFEHLSTIIEGAKESARLGVCLDTCHLLAAGYDISTEEGYDSTFKQFENTIGWSRLKVLHINDSKHPAGSRRDRHDHIGKGFVGLEGFGRLLRDPRLDGLPMILETPKSSEKLTDPNTVDSADKRNLQALRKLLKERS